MQCRKPSGEECKQEVITLVLEQDMPATQVARDVGIRLDTLHRWLRAACLPASPTNAAPAPTTELVRLRRENERLRMERDIRTKALGIFSQMPQ